MKLLIVESPGKVKKIQSFLGADWKVAASVGHVRDLPVRDIGVEPPLFVPRYVETDRGSKVISDLKVLAGKSESVWLATDPDREGEAIAWHLAEALSLKDPLRVAYSEITEPAVMSAIGRPRAIDLDLVRAQEGRRVLDRLVGYKVSPALSRVSMRGASAGRVQTPAVRLVAEREEAIRGFKQTTHFGVVLAFDELSGVSKGWRATWDSKPWLDDGEDYVLDKELAARVAELRSLKVIGYEEGEARQAPPAPFTTSTLQQAASNALGLDPKNTMALAQRLYESGHITYMRTDSPNLSTEAVAEVRSLASKMDWPVPASPRVWKSKEGAQEAHEAIRPTHCESEEAGETEAEASLYRLIRLRALASQLDDAVYSVAKASLKSELDGKDVLFVAKGRKIKEQGWKVATGVDQADEASEEKDGKESEDLDNPVPMLREGAVLDPTSAEVKTKKTSPPSRYTQATLIRELEKRGIGRPSTYAAIMGNISDKGYVSANKKRQLEATELGELVVSHLKNNFDFCDYEYTKKMELLLDEIADGKNSYLPVVSDAYKTLSVQLEQFLTLKGTRCPICGGLLSHYVRSGQGGYDFWVCDDKENCSGRFKNDGGKLGDRIVPVELSEHKCEACGKQLRHLVKEGPGGYNFWACSDRNCNSTYKDEGGMPGELSARKPKPKVSGFCCPSCKSPLYRRRGFSEKTKRDYDFFACPNKTCNATYNCSNDKPLFKNYGNKSQK